MTYIHGRSEFKNLVLRNVQVCALFDQGRENHLLRDKQVDTVKFNSIIDVYKLPVYHFTARKTEVSKRFQF